MRKIFKTSELKAQVHSQKEVCKWKAMAISAGKRTLLSLWKKSSNKDGWARIFAFSSNFKKEK